MLHEYRSLSRREAIEQLLAERIGTIVHIDLIVRSLYGELQPKVFKVGHNYFLLVNSKFNQAIAINRR